MKSDETDRRFFVPWFAVSRPVTVIMLFIATLIVGVIAYMNIPLQLVPSGFTPPFLYVTIPTIPATPADVEREIVEPVEDILRTVRNVRRIRARARPDNAGFFVAFADGTDMRVAYNQVRDRLERVKSDLPPETRRWFIWKFDPDEDPLMFTGVQVDAPPEEQDTLLQTNVVQKLEQLAEVSRVEIWGGRGLEVVVDVDDKRANAAGVPIAEIIRTLQNDNFTMAGGVVDDGQTRFPVRVLASIDDIEALKALPIRGGLTLGDVADVKIQQGGRNEIYRVGGKDGAIVAVYKESSQNAVDAADVVRQTVAQIDRDERIAMSVLFDQGEVIESSLDNLTETALWGGLFALIVLFLFLRRFRMMAVTAAAIPISMLLTLVVMYLTGSTLNALSLMGLMLSVGMVVDNSIVVVESIQRRRAMGEDARTAAPAGAAEVGLAIFVATSTTIVVFLPMVLMSGNETIGFYLGKIGYPVCISLLASLVVSLVFIPLALTKIDTEQVPTDTGIIAKIQVLYGEALKWCLRNRSSALLFIGLSMATAYIPFSNLKETDKVQANINDVRVFFAFEPTATFEERFSRIKLFEAWVADNKEKYEIKTWTTRMGGMWGHPEMRIFLSDVEDRTLSREEVVESIRTSLPKVSGVRWRLGWGGSDDTEKVTVNIQGPDTDRLAELARLVSRRLENIDGVLSVVAGKEEQNALEMHYSIDPDIANRTGVTPLLVGGAIDYTLRGRRLGTIVYRDQNIPLWIKTASDRDLSKEELENVSIPSPLGGPGIPIGIATSTTVKPGYNEIERQDGQTRTQIQINTTRDDLNALGEEIDRALDGFQMPEGYTVRKGQRFTAMDEEDRDRKFALTLAIVFVFLLMGILFESFVLPLVIVLSIPFAFLGVYWTLFLTGTPFDVMAGVGLIILVGIVVNNAIVLVDRVNMGLASDQLREEALVEAGMIRLRPIVMTALTTIGGLIPMAIGASQIVGIPYAPLGRTVIGGLIASTFFTLFVVPIFFTVFDDLRIWLMRR